MVKNMCFLLKGHKFKSRGGRVCIPSQTLPVKSLGGGGSLVPQTRGSHTLIWCGLAMTLKIDCYYYYYYYYYNNPFTDLKLTGFLYIFSEMNVVKNTQQNCIAMFKQKQGVVIKPKLCTSSYIFNRTVAFVTNSEKLCPSFYVSY